MTISELRHARVHLALHTLQSGEGRALLFLHTLGGAALDWPRTALGWRGPAYALDLSGHGRSGRLRGGAYTTTLWAADADHALAQLADDALVVGAGLGAYLALLLAGARPASVRGALLLPGAGLHGGGAEPDFSRLPTPLTASIESGGLREVAELDPAVHFSEQEVRPTGHARALAEAARCLVLTEDGDARPEWWRALHGLPNVHALAAGTPASGLAHLTQLITATR